MLFNPKETFRFVTNVFAQQAKLQNSTIIFQEIEKKLPEKLVGDKTRLNQVLVNLIKNALKFSSS